MKKEKVGIITFEESEVDQIEGMSEEDAEKVYFNVFHQLTVVLQGVNTTEAICLRF